MDQLFIEEILNDPNAESDLKTLVYFETPNKDVEERAIFSLYTYLLNFLTFT